jgi:hypothetical protein
MSPILIFSLPFVKGFGYIMQESIIKAKMVNPVRKSSIFSREGSHRALNPVFAPRRKLPSIPAANPDRSEASHGGNSGVF